MPLQKQEKFRHLFQFWMLKWKKGSCSCEGACKSHVTEQNTRNFATILHPNGEFLLIILSISNGYAISKIIVLRATVEVLFEPSKHTLFNA
jgi:hypothetical protein